MYTAVFDTWVNLTGLPTTRRLRALRQARLFEVEMGDQALLELVDRAIAHDTQTLKNEGIWANRRRHRVSESRSRLNELLAALDRRLDGSLAGLLQILRATITALPEGHPNVVAAQTLENVLFPAGLAAIVNIAFEEQLQHVDLIIERLRGEYAEIAAQLHLGDFIEEIDQQRLEFRETLNRRAEDEGELSFDTLREQRGQGHEMLAMYVAAVLGGNLGTDESSEQLRVRLLAPVEAQQRAVLEARRRRRSPGEVDIDTGDVVAESEDEV